LDLFACIAPSTANPGGFQSSHIQMITATRLRNPVTVIATKSRSILSMMLPGLKPRRQTASVPVANAEAVAVLWEV
jgi:hypothetical protein